MQLDPRVRTAIEAEVGSPKALGSGKASELGIFLRNAQRHSIRLGYVATAMAVCLFVLMVVLLVMLRENAALLTALGAVLGTSLAGTIRMVVKTSSAVTQAGLLSALVSQLPSEDALEAFRAVLRADTSGKPAEQ
jgi:hypothetical protein